MRRCGYQYYVSFLAQVERPEKRPVESMFFFLGGKKAGKCIMHRDARAPCVGLSTARRWELPPVGQSAA